MHFTGTSLRKIDSELRFENMNVAPGFGKFHRNEADYIHHFQQFVISISIEEIKEIRARFALQIFEFLIQSYLAESSMKITLVWLACFAVLIVALEGKQFWFLHGIFKVFNQQIIFPIADNIGLLCRKVSLFCPWYDFHL